VNVFNDTLLRQQKVDVEVVTTQGIEALLVPIGCLQGAEIVRVAVVVENDLLV
jgi:hypothetical protein